MNNLYNTLARTVVHKTAYISNLKQNKKLIAHNLRSVMVINGMPPSPHVHTSNATMTSIYSTLKHEVQQSEEMGN
jgi:hypothetical protein